MSEQTQSPNLFAQAVALAVLLAGLNLWSNYHLGTGITQIGWIGSLIAAFTFAVAFLDKLIDESEKKNAFQSIKKAIRMLLAWPVLIVLYLVSLLVVFGYAAVIVVPSSASEALVVRLEETDGSNTHVAETRGGTPRFRVRTSPFGRSYRLKAEGYVAETIEVFPIIGLKIKPEKDLRPSPSVLFRPPSGALRDLDDGGSLVVRLLRNGEEEEIARGDGRRSFIVGVARKLPGDLIGDWKLELEALGLVGEKAVLMPGIILAWKRPASLKPKIDLEPGMILRAEVRSRSGKCAARAEITLTRETLVDVSMDACEE